MFYVVGFILIAVGLVAWEFIKSYASGWWNLAKKYRCDRDFNDDGLAYFKFCKIGFVNYPRSLRIRATRKGLYLKAIGMLINYFHPELFIPWSDVANITDTVNMFQKMMVVEVADPPVKLTLPQGSLDDASEYWSHLYYAIGQN